MKKIYLSAFAAVLSVGMTSAQVQERPYSFNDQKIDGVEQAPTDPISTSKALGVTFWTNDFTNASDWTISNDGQVTPFGWNIGTTVNTWWATFQPGINTTGNFAEVYNGNYNTGNQAIGVTYRMTTATPIDVMSLGGTEQVSLSFKQYGALFNDGQTVLISTNGTTFTEVYTNNNRTVYLGNNPTAAYANPETISVSIANALAGSGATSVWIRYEWTSRFPSSTSPNAWTTFGWFIDDVALTTNPDNNITAESSVWGTAGLNYSKIPLSQQTGIEFSTKARNNGINPQTNVQLNVNVTGATTYSGTSNAVTIQPAAADSLVLTTPFTPSGLGTYNVAWNLSQTEVDDVPTDNANAPVTFDVTSFTYARDRGTQTGTFANVGEAFVLGSYYDIFANATIYSVDVRIASTAVIGSVITARIYSIDPNATTLDAALILEDQSLEHTIATGNPGSIINLDLAANGSSGFQMNAGETYFLAVSSDGDGGTTAGASIGTAGTAPAQTCFFYDGPDATWYYTTNIPMVRMNLDPASNTIGLEENNQLFGAEVFPNPASDKLNVRYATSVASDVTIKVTDITGKVIATMNEGTKEAGTHQLEMNTASFAEGVYYVTIASGNSVITKKVVKN